MQLTRAAMRRAQWAVFATFFLNGFVFANWVPRIPEIRATHGLSEAELGLVLLALASGALLSMIAVGRIVDRVGTRPIMTVTALLFPLSFAQVPLATSPVVLALLLALFGATMAALDVAMNVAGAHLERRLQRLVFARFHGGFSIGSMAGALCGAAAASSELAISLHFALAATASAPVLLLSARAIPPPVREAAPTQSATSSTSLLRAFMMLFAAGAFFSLLAEGAVADWSAIFLTDHKGASAGIAGLAFAACSGAMALGRLTGDRIIARWGRGTVLAACGLLAASGYAIVSASDALVMVVIGFGVLGLGLSCTFPALLSAAMNAAGPAAAGAAVAALSTVGYFGFLLGPPLIGFAAEWAGLPRVLAAVFAGVCLVTIAIRLAYGRDAASFERARDERSPGRADARS